MSNSVIANNGWYARERLNFEPRTTEELQETRDGMLFYGVLYLNARRKTRLKAIEDILTEREKS